MFCFPNSCRERACVAAALRATGILFWSCLAAARIATIHCEQNIIQVRSTVAEQAPAAHSVQGHRAFISCHTPASCCAVAQQWSHAKPGPSAASPPHSLSATFAAGLQIELGNHEALLALGLGMCSTIALWAAAHLQISWQQSGRKVKAQCRCPDVMLQCVWEKEGPPGPPLLPAGRG